MVMESISPQCVGKEFVRQYYTVLNKAPLHLHRFYSDDSSFVHGGLDQSDEDPVVGQQDIHQKIMQLNFRDCHAKIRQVDAHSTLKDGVVVQVIGELSNNGEPMRQFMQTFVLAPQNPKKYYVRNDIFRYQDQVFIEDEDYENTDTVMAPVLKLQALHLNVQAEKDLDDQLSTIADSCDNNNFYDKDYIRNGTTHLNENELPPLSTLTTASSNNNNSSNVNTTSSQGLSNLGGGGMDLSPSQPLMEVPSVHTEPLQGETMDSPCKSDWEDSVDGEEEDEEEVPRVVATTVTEQQHLRKSDLHLIEMEDIGEQNLLTPTEPKTYANMVSKNTPPSGVLLTHLPGPPSLGTPFTNQIPQQQQQQPSPNTPSLISSGPKSTSDFPKLDHHPHHTTQQQSISPNNFTAPGGNFRGVSARTSRYNNHRNNTNGRLPNNDSNSGNIGGSSLPFSSNRYNDDSGSEGMVEKRKSFNVYQDSQQLFVGNLPHEIGQDDLKEIFQKFGPVLDMRINTKLNPKMGPTGKSPVPNYGFIVFEDEDAVQKVLQNKPILYGQHRLNVEEKKAKPRDLDRMMPTRGSMIMRMGSGGMTRGGPRPIMRGGDRGRGGPNYPRR